VAPEEALRLVCDTEGEVDIVTEVSPKTPSGSSNHSTRVWSRLTPCV
jgi:hypothetical protein